jgi:hypothetical protein
MLVAMVIILGSTNSHSQVVDPMLSVARVMASKAVAHASNNQVLADGGKIIKPCDNPNRPCITYKLVSTGEFPCNFGLTFDDKLIVFVSFPKVSTEYRTYYKFRQHHAEFSGEGVASCWDFDEEKRGCSKNLLLHDWTLEGLQRTVRALSYIQQTICPPLTLQPY